jgi:hypothetical protein
VLKGPRFAALGIALIGGLASRGALKGPRFAAAGAFGIKWFNGLEGPKGSLRGSGFSEFDEETDLIAITTPFIFSLKTSQLDPRKMG